MLIQPMLARLREQTDFHETLSTVLTDTVALVGAEFGKIQVLASGRDRLILAAYINLPAFFAEQLAVVSLVERSVCARAATASDVVIVADVETDPDFRPFVELAARVGFRSLLSAPLLTSDDKLVGVVTAHFARPHRPSALEMSTLKQYCRAAADYLRPLVPKDLDRCASEPPMLLVRADGSLRH